MREGGKEGGRLGSAWSGGEGRKEGTARGAWLGWQGGCSRARLMSGFLCGVCVCEGKVGVSVLVMMPESMLRAAALFEALALALRNCALLLLLIVILLGTLLIMLVLVTTSYEACLCEGVEGTQGGEEMTRKGKCSSALFRRCPKGTSRRRSSPRPALGLVEQHHMHRRTNVA